ncbi:2989_t:CDS:2 [Funneliformis caledonium]|uniref:2989_t:CDS:1 n=1 Tax=Funneliformis caledonium TaxID=1117310 RepID=A0A9N9BSI7_9GLOM|nr:2989_t:CDS:2 [Funneliformis caledonium]
MFATIQTPISRTSSTSTIISEDSTLDSDCSFLDFDHTFEDPVVTSNTSEQDFVPSLMQFDEELNTIMIDNEILEPKAGEDTINVDRNVKEMNQVSNTATSLYEEEAGSRNHSQLDHINIINGIPEMVEDNNNSEAIAPLDEIQQSSVNEDRENVHKIIITLSQAKRIANTSIDSDERADVLENALVSDNETTSNLIHPQNVESDNSPVPNLDMSLIPVNQSRTDNFSAFSTGISPNINISSPVEVKNNTLANDLNEEKLISNIDSALSDNFSKICDHGNFRTIPKAPRKRSLKNETSNNTYTLPSLSDNDIINNMEKVEIHQVDHKSSSELLPIDSEFRLNNDKVDHNNEGCIDEMKLKEESIRNAYSGITIALKHQLMLYNNLREIIPEYVRRPVESSIGIIRFSIEPPDLIQDVITAQEQKGVFSSSTSPIEGNNDKDNLVKEEFVSSSQKPKDIISSRAKKWHELPDDMKEYYQRKAKRLRHKYSQNQSGSQLVKPGKDESELLTVAIPKFSLRPVIPIVTMTPSQHMDFAQHKR